MISVAQTKYVRLSVFKARDLARKIVGLSANVALSLLQANKRKASCYLYKTLKSAIANAENNKNVSADLLIVKDAVVNEGPRMKRYWPRSRGSASPILKRFSHVEIVLDRKI